jgi:hypothetical protein
MGKGPVDKRAIYTAGANPPYTLQAVFTLKAS